jgi:hypothetical protein
MNAKDDVFRLVKSLGKNEKRFFNLFSSLSRENKNYMRLFRVLDRMQAYDEAKVKKIFAGEKLQRNLPYEKNYLQKQILRTLRIFHSENSNEIIINNLLQDIELLMNRRQFDAARTLLTKAKTLALKFELFPAYLNALKWELRLAHRLGDLEFLTKKAASLFKDEKNILEKQLNLSAYRNLQSQLTAIIQRKGNVLKKRNVQAMKRIMNHPLLKNEKRALSFLGRCHFHELWSLYHLQTGDYQAAYLNHKKLKKVFESDNEKIEIFPQPYFACLSSLSSRCIVLGKFDEALADIEKMELLSSDRGIHIHDALKAEVRIIAFERKMLIYHFRREFEKGLEVSRFLSPAFARRKSFELFHHLFTAIALFETGNLHLALKTINPVIGAGKDAVRLDYVYSAHFLRLALHFDLHNYDSIPYFIKSSQRYFKSREVEFKCHEIIFDFFAKAIKSKTKTSLTQLADSAAERLRALEKNPSEKMLLENFDIVTWLKRL